MSIEVRYHMLRPDQIVAPQEGMPRGVRSCRHARMAWCAQPSWG